MSPNSCCRNCCRGLYSCYWQHPSGRKKRWAGFWFFIVTLVSFLSLCWMYICLVTFNDREDVNWKLFKLSKLQVNWFMVLIIMSAVLTCYCVLLLLLALFHKALGEPLDLHWLHKILLCIGALIIACGVAGITIMWIKEWPTVLLSLQATAPFLQLGGVGALTLISWLVFQGFHKTRRAGSKLLIIGTFALLSVFMFLCPLLINSPCLIELKELPDKPALIGHRGAPMLAPENTMMSFSRSVACNVTAFETDVQLSKDKVPFLMHDNGTGFLRRTTNASGEFNHSKELTWKELQSLNAGEWFLETDPFHSMSQLSVEEREMVRTQNIPSLLQLLDLAKQHNISIIFDLKNDDNDTVATVETILNSSIPLNLVLWLPSAEREDVMDMAPDFIQVYDKVSDMERNGGHHLNLKYSSLSATEIRELRSKNVSVNLWVVNERWLFSLLWCSGASSVTTNACHLLQDLTQPDWTLAPGEYRAIWITVDLASLVIMIVLFILQRKRCCFGYNKAGKEKTSLAWNQRELSPFLPTE